MAINTNVSSAAINNVGTQISNFMPSVWSKKILDKLKLECKLVETIRNSGGNNKERFVLLAGIRR